MRIVLFCHSLLSDWNHGNAHFLRGIVTELQARGHTVDVFEPRDAWSAAHLVREHGEAALAATRRVYPSIAVHRYDEASLDLDDALADVDLTIVHEWNSHALVRAVGNHHRRNADYVLLFHDTHHRSVSAPDEMASYDLAYYDGVLAFGEVIRQCYLDAGWTARAWTWHEAADLRVFRPLPRAEPCRDLVWIGNWGDGERTAEIEEYIVAPIEALRLSATIHGVRYPDDALARLRKAGIEFGGWLPNYEVPAAFGRHRVTVHVPRGPYARTLPGIPTIRMFEALACGIPLVTAPWDDAEGLFEPGADYLVAANRRQMRRLLCDVLDDPALARALAERGRARIEERHTCAHRVDELLAICTAVRPAALGTMTA